MRHLLSTFLLGLLAACGGGTNENSRDLDNAAPLAAEMGTVTANPKEKTLANLHSASVGNTNSSTVKILALNLASEHRVSRTVYEYVYLVKIENSGSSLTDVKIALTGAGPGTMVVDGLVSVNTLAAGVTVTPTDTIAIRQDRTLPFQPTELIWSITGSTVPPSSSIGGNDADADGTRDDVQAFIVGTYGATPQIKDALLQLASGLQLAITAADSSSLNAARVARRDAGLCLIDSVSDPALAQRLVNEVKLRQWDSPERFAAELRFSDSLAGTVESPLPTAMRSTCR